MIMKVLKAIIGDSSFVNKNQIYNFHNTMQAISEIRRNMSEFIKQDATIQDKTRDIQEYLEDEKGI